MKQRAVVCDMYNTSNTQCDDYTVTVVIKLSALILDKISDLLLLRA